MKIILDEDTPAPLIPYLIGQQATTVPKMGWAGIQNDALLTLIQEHGFDVFLTCDRNLEYQQNLAGRLFSIIVLKTPNKKIETLLPLVPQVLALLPVVQPGMVYHVEKLPEAQT